MSDGARRRDGTKPLNLGGGFIPLRKVKCPCKKMDKWWNMFGPVSFGLCHEEQGGGRCLSKDKE